ncbi:hypothetical protein [Alicyclobacillus sp. ALC3]|uniref:hypothetical protein n=1 Tax=Alicyclobacillus sp. ALC3 TaxID=2796143 RepID=UPI002378AF8B|nr:hypothetical protein [Alicyclobacillus sp. ALC3]WDL95245.1 hypothetical protein JC200_12545 [Alicyclobacillus sp. ALC3]
MSTEKTEYVYSLERHELVPRTPALYVFKSGFRYVDGENYPLASEQPVRVSGLNTAPNTGPSPHRIKEVKSMSACAVRPGEGKSHGG